MAATLQQKNDLKQQIYAILGPGRQADSLAKAVDEMPEYEEPGSV